MARTSSQLVFDSYASFPTTGGSNILYIATDTNKIYKWNGTTYVELSNASGVYTTITDPAVNAATSTAIINAYDGVIITTTGVSNAQTLQNPTVVTAGKMFTVVNNDTSTNAITINGVTLNIGTSFTYVWDGSAWTVVTPVTASQIANIPAGNIAATNVQSAINELDTEKAALTGATFTGQVTAQAATDTSTGSELITNVVDRDFSGAGNWDTGTGTWSIVGATWTHAASANATFLPIVNMVAAPVVSSIYKIVATIVTITPGTLTITYGGTSASIVGRTTSTLTAYTVELIAANITGPLTFTPNANWEGSIDNVSVTLVTASTAGITAKNAAGVVGIEERAILGSSFGIGNNALRTSTGTNNTAVGNVALRNNTSGTSNTAVGSSALQQNTTGVQNTALGYSALNANTTATQNTAVGANTLLVNNVGEANTALGYEAMTSNTAGSYNVAVGLSSLRSNTTAIANTAIGANSLYTNTTGDYNAAYGLRSLFQNISGTYNVGCGTDTMQKNSTGSYNTAVGGEAGYTNQTGANNVSVGYKAGKYNVGSSRLYIDAFDRTNTAGDNAGAIITGIMNTTPANQLLTFNAATTTTVSSTSPIVIGGTTTTSTLQIRPTSGAGTTGADIIFQSGTNGGTETMRILNNGRVGIGINAPSYLLDINAVTGPANIHVVAAVGTNYSIMRAQNTGGEMYFGKEGSAGGNLGTGTTAYAGIINAQGAYPLQQLVDNLIVMTLMPTTLNIGMSATGDSYGEASTDITHLEIGGKGTASASSNGKLILMNNRATATVGDICGKLTFASLLNSGTAPKRETSSIYSILTGSGGPNGFGSDLVFTNKVDNAATTIERMRLLANGNFGIGTLSPLAKLAVLGDINIGNDVSDANAIGTMTFYQPVSPTTSPKIDGYRNSGGDANSLRFFTAYSTLAERMRIDFFGRVGIGITAPTAVLNIKAGTTAAESAPIKLTSGSLMTNAEAGAVEFLTDRYYATTTTGPTRKEIQLYDTYHGGFYAYNKAIPFQITVADTYHGLHLVTAGDIVTGLVAGFTFGAGRVVDPNITSEANGTGGKLRIVCNVAHGLTTGDLVVIGNANNAGHNKPTRITTDGTNPTTEFLCDDIAYVAGAGASAATVIQPSFIKAGTGSAGVYSAGFTVDGTASNANKVWKWELVGNVTPFDNIVSSRLSTNTLTSMTSTGNITVTDGMYIWLSAKNVTDITDYTIQNCNINIHRI